MCTVVLLTCDVERHLEAVLAAAVASDALTCDVERHLEAVLAAAVASDARVETTVVLSCRVNNERVKSILVHDDFMVGVVMNLCDVGQPNKSKAFTHTLMNNCTLVHVRTCIRTRTCMNARYNTKQTFHMRRPIITVLHNKIQSNNTFTHLHLLPTCTCLTS